LPPTTAAARIGSVGVRQAATARDDRKFSPGMRAKIRAADTNHPYVTAVSGLQSAEKAERSAKTYPCHNWSEKEE
jgi:hypothetical protein